VCDGLGIPRSTYYYSVRPHLEPVPSKRVSHRALSEAERQEATDLLHSSRFVDLAPPAIVATLLDEGKYICSSRTLYRILASLEEVRERRAVARRPRYQKPELLATKPNQVWSWDITKLKTFEKWVYCYLYVLLDVFSRYVVGYLVATEESAELARELIEQSCQKQNILPGSLTIHSDRGAAMTSKTLGMLYSDLGITKSLSRPSVSDDNPFSESQFKTLKYSRLFLDKIGNLSEARNLCRELMTWYNQEHKHSSIGYYTPQQVHYGEHSRLREVRERALHEAFTRHPERFRAQPSPAPVPQAVWINPPESLPGLVTDLYEKNEFGIFIKK
jgi:putative transposase